MTGPDRAGVCGMKLRFLFGVLAVLLASGPLAAQVPGKNTPVLRGQPQEVYFFPAAPDSGRPAQKVLFAPGDAGMWGTSVEMAKTIASWGYDVYGLDTKDYLSSFTGKTTLKETEVMSDFRALARWISHGRPDPVILVGWSEGAGLCLLAAVPPENVAV